MTRYLIPAFLFLFLAACSDDSNPDAYLPEANGQHGEILLIMDNNLWNGSIGQSVQDRFSQIVKGPYLRPEPTFSFYRKTPEDVNHVNQMNRNILKFMIDTDSTYAETAVIEKRNYYAKNQLFLIVKDSDPDRLAEFAQNDLDQIVETFNDFELQQLIRMYEEDPNKRVKEMAENKFGISISVPRRSVLKSEKENFVLVKHDRSKNVLPNDATKAQGGTFWIQQGFLFWSTPYIPDSAQMTVENVLKDRDTTLKYNVPGKTKGTYMGTEYTEHYEPKGRVFDFHGYKTVEVQGLWIYEGDTFVGGGGPFVQYSILNEADNRIITVCGYIYAPYFDKREYIRELHAVLNTIEINS